MKVIKKTKLLIIWMHIESLKYSDCFLRRYWLLFWRKELLPALKQHQVKLISGISTPVYFLTRLGLSWEEVYLTSVHGKQCNLINKVRSHPMVCSLLGGDRNVNTVCEKLCTYGYSDIDVTIGERLSYPDEQITKGKPKDFLEKEFDPLSVILIENPNASNKEVHSGIDDSMFIRGKIPMTKRDVRGISLNRLQLTKDAVVYDIGAGTGSVAVEAAYRCEDGMVYAIEQKKEGIALIQENAKRFQVDNIITIEGMAPSCMEELPAPTHVFIGGSSGILRNILAAIRKKSSRVRVVVNAISLDTVSEVLQMTKEFDMTEFDMVQAGITPCEIIGSHHMMKAQNPIMIISFTLR